MIDKETLITVSIAITGITFLLLGLIGGLIQSYYHIGNILTTLGEIILFAIGIIFLYSLPRPDF
jgi:ribose/xylose/arabinose/galactoside ABC-type transport system permease subunit